MQGIAWAVFDREGESQNSLGRRALEELAAIVERAEQGARDKSIRGLVFISGKEKGFIVGADVREFDQAQTEQQVADAVSLVNGYLDRIERLPVPVVCCIHGFCLGGGLELALACHWRIATRDDATRIGFPEVRLGIFPGFNGTARSIRQAGALSAMPLMLTGSMIRAGAARGMGLIDELAPSPLNLAWMARKAIERKRKSKAAPLWKDVLRQCAGARAAGQEIPRRDGQEGARGALSRALPPDRPVRDARRQSRRHEGGGDARLRAADGGRDLEQPAPRVQALGDDEGAGAEDARLQAAARACDRRRRDGRRHCRLVRRLRHGGVAAGRERRADRQGHRRAEEGHQPQVQDQGAAGRRDGAPDRRSQGSEHRPRRRGDRGDRREARGQAEPLQVARGQAQARRDPGHQHLLDHDREDRRAAGRSRPSDRHPLLQSGGADAARRGHQGRREPRRGGAARAAPSSPPSTSSR